MKLGGQALRLRPSALAQMRPPAVAAAGLVALLLFALPTGTAPADTGPVAQRPAAGGTWYCPVTARDDEAAVLTVTAAGGEPSLVTLLRAGEQGLQVDRELEVQPGDAYQARLAPAAAAQPWVVLWEGGAAVASWRADARDAAGATCVDRPSATWHVAGLDTAAGASSVLHLFNPFADDVVADLRFATPAGPVRLVGTEGLVIPAGRAVALDVAEVQPEEPDLAAVVEVSAGRLIVQAEVRVPGGAGGRSVVSAAPSPHGTWAFGLARGERSELSLLNPNDRPAAVQVRVSSPRGGAVAGGALGEVSVAPGGVARLDLQGASDAREYGVVAESVNGVGIVASQRLRATLTPRRAVTAIVAGQAPADVWLLPAAGGDRRSVVGVYNPGSTPVRVELSSPDAPAHDVGVLAANAAVVVDLVDIAADAPAAPVTVVADGPVAATRWTYRGDGPLGLTTATGAAASSWTGPATRPNLRRDPALASL